MPLRTLLILIIISISHLSVGQDTQWTEAKFLLDGKRSNSTVYMDSEEVWIVEQHKGSISIHVIDTSLVLAHHSSIEAPKAEFRELKQVDRGLLFSYIDYKNELFTVLFWDKNTRKHQTISTPRIKKEELLDVFVDQDVVQVISRYAKNPFHDYQLYLASYNLQTNESKKSDLKRYLRATQPYGDGYVSVYRYQDRSKYIIRMMDAAFNSSRPEIEISFDDHKLSQARLIPSDQEGDFDMIGMSKKNGIPSIFFLRFQNFNPSDTSFYEITTHQNFFDYTQALGDTDGEKKALNRALEKGKPYDTEFLYALNVLPGNDDGYTVVMDACTPEFSSDTEYDQNSVFAEGFAPQGPTLADKTTSTFEGYYFDHSLALTLNKDFEMVSEGFLNLRLDSSFSLFDLVYTEDWPKKKVKNSFGLVSVTTILNEEAIIGHYHSGFLSLLRSDHGIWDSEPQTSEFRNKENAEIHPYEGDIHHWYGNHFVFAASTLESKGRKGYYFRKIRVD